MTIQGQGAKSSTSYNIANNPPNSPTGTDSTIINASFPGNNAIWSININAGKTLRMTGIYFNGSGESANSNGMVTFSGAWTGQLRLDHCHVFINPSTSGIGINGPIIGVADHDFLETTGGTATNTNDFRFFNGPGWNGQSDPNGLADPSFANGDNFGTNLFFYVEDSYFLGGYTGDCDHGGRFVIRYTSEVNTNGQAQHGLYNSSFRPCRAAEFYNDSFTGSTNQIAHPNSGTLMAWGITSSGTAIAIPQMERTWFGEGRDAEEMTPPPTTWGYCGAKYATGTASTTANSTAVTGTGFLTSWPNNPPFLFNIWLPGAQCAGRYGDLGSACAVSPPVSSTTALTLNQVATVGVSGITYVVGSQWDGGTLNTGYPCLDSPGRGAGDLLNGLTMPNRLNTLTSTITWPHEVLSPIYVWNTTLSSGGLVSDNTGTLADNRDYYMQLGTFGEPGSNCTASSGCNITVGINQTNRDPINGSDTCTGGSDPALGASPGVGWWNPNHPGDSTHSAGALWVCNPTNTWSIYYQPYIYPHALITSQISIMPNPVAFGNQPIGGALSSISVVITNNTNAAVTLQNPYFTITGTNAADFVNLGSLVNPCLNGGVLAANGGVCNLSIQFTPTVNGAETATLTILSGALPATAAITGTGTLATLLVSPVSANFGTVNVGSTANQSFTLTNTGTGTLTGLTLSLSDATNFSIPAGTNTCSTTLPPNGNCTFVAQFNPTVQGALSATITITSNASNSPTVVPLSGTGAIPGIGFGTKINGNVVINGGVAVN
jgi:hypothetical protein